MYNFMIREDDNKTLFYSLHIAQLGFVCFEKESQSEKKVIRITTVSTKYNY